MSTRNLRRNLSIFALFVFNSSFGQDGADIPVYYFNQFNTTITNNPSAIVDTSKIELGAFYNAFSGAFSKIRNFEAYCFYRPSTKSSWFLELNSDQQGPVFQKNKIYAGHLQNITLSKQIRLQMGMKLGVVNYSFEPSQNGTGGSDYGFDGTVSLSLFTQKWLIGSAWQQFLSTELQPIDQTYILDDYWEVHAYYLWKNNQITVKSGIRNRIAPIQTAVQLSTQVQYLSFLAGGSISNLGFSLNGGFLGNFVKIHHRQILINFLYYTPFNSNLKIVRQNRMEIILKVFISGK